MCFSFDSVNDGFVRRLAEAAVNAGLFVVCESRAQSLWSVVEGIAEGLVDALDGVAAGHEDLYPFG